MEVSVSLSTPRLESRSRFRISDLSEIVNFQPNAIIPPDRNERELSRLLTSAMRTFLISYSIINPLVISDYFRHANEMTSCHRLV